MPSPRLTIALFLAALLGVGAVTWYLQSFRYDSAGLQRPDTPPSEEASGTSLPLTSSSLPGFLRSPNSPGATPTPGILPLTTEARERIIAAQTARDRSPFFDGLNASTRTAGADIEQLERVFDEYQILIKDGGNPTGLNAEITRAFLGDNRMQIALLPADHPAISPTGELVDRWGTPFFFHALSSTEMEIRSAGPDRMMYTDDDVVSEPAR